MNWLFCLHMITLKVLYIKTNAFLLITQMEMDEIIIEAG